MRPIRHATPQDAPALNTALRALSEHLGDVHRASDDELRRALEEGRVHGLIIEDTVIVGALLMSAVFSTVQGKPGVYMSDVWVDADHRHAGLGSELLDSALSYGAKRWNASFVSLVVYDDNEDGRAFYRSLGFEDHGRFLVR